MELRGEQRIAAPRAQVWAMLNDPEVLGDCIPGCETLEGSAADGFAARVTTKIGPVKATFNGAVTLSNVNPPESYTISGEGKGGVAGFAKGGADVHLADDGSATLLTYVANAQVGGKLAQLGSRLVDSTAKKLADQFFACFAERAGATTERLSAAEVGASGASPHGPEGARLDTGELSLPGQSSPVAPAVSAPLAVGDVMVPGPLMPPHASGPPIIERQTASPDFVPPLPLEPDLRSSRADVTPLSHGAAVSVMPPATTEQLDPGTGIEALAHDVEEEVEAKAAVGFLGGPTVWGLLVILALIVIYYFAR